MRGEWHGADYEALSRVWELERLMDAPLGNEIHRHVVVAAIAALQTFHRATIVGLVNHSEAYRSRAAGLVDDKFTLKDALTFLGDGKLSAAELIAHAAPCNSIHGLLSSMSRVLDQDIKGALERAVQPHARHDPQPEDLIVADPDDLISKLGEAFRLRHILAHEAAPSLIITKDTAAQTLWAVRLWMEAMQGVLWSTAYLDRPLNQFEMNIAADIRVQEARRELAGALAWAMRFARHIGKGAAVRRAHLAWKAATLEWITWAYWEQQGTMWGAVGAEEMARLYRQRAEQLSRWQAYQVP